MSTSRDFVDHVHQQSGLGEALTHRRMFGEVAFYLDGKVVALGCDDCLYVRPSSAVDPGAEGFELDAPYPGAKPHLVVDRLLDDPPALADLLRRTAAALPAPKPKRRRGQ